MIENKSSFKVIFIGGCTRSGSTLLADLLAQSDRVVNVGELINIWRWCYIENRLCGCGAIFDQCPFWGEVSQSVFGVPSARVPRTEMAKLYTRAHGLSKMTQLWYPPVRSAQFRKGLDEYLSLIPLIYRAVARISGCELIVDSSKDPDVARMVREAIGLQAHMIHLVRDARGVAASYRRHRIQRAVHWEYQELPRKTVSRSIFAWVTLNLLTQFEGRRFASYTRLTYEDLVGSPGPVLRSLAGTIGEPEVGQQLEALSNPIDLKPSHSVAGNPSRFEAGPTDVRMDDGWMTELPAWKRHLTTAAAGPLLSYYGYPLYPWRTGRREAPLGVESSR